MHHGQAARKRGRRTRACQHFDACAALEQPADSRRCPQVANRVSKHVGLHASAPPFTEELISPVSRGTSVLRARSELEGLAVALLRARYRAAADDLRALVDAAWPGVDMSDFDEKVRPPRKGGGGGGGDKRRAGGVGDSSR
jgi:hypothetical protein